MAKRNQTVSYEDTARATRSMVREPELIPEGSWIIRNTGFSKSAVKDKEGNEQACYNLRYEPFEAGPDVDPELIEAGGYEGRTLWVRRYISEPLEKASRDGTLGRFFKFADMHDGELDPELGVDATAKELKGHMLRATIGTRAYTTKEGDDVTDNTATEFASVEA